jgi:hypothetical protein
MVTLRYAPNISHNDDSLNACKYTDFLDKVYRTMTLQRYTVVKLSLFTDKSSHIYIEWIFIITAMPIIPTNKFGKTDQYYKPQLPVSV